MKTLQDAFNTMYRHLHSLEVRCTDDGGRCAYRNCYGNKCLLGALIDDEHYSKTLEGSTSSCDNVVQALSKSGYPMLEIDLYTRMQYIHDSHFRAEDREDMIKRIAKDYELDIPTLD